MRARRVDGFPLDEEGFLKHVAPFAEKFEWFRSKGYTPHTWQSLFHAMRRDDRHIQRMRHLVAGRRGGKTLAAAWEVLYYAVNPSAYWADTRGEAKSDRLWIWCITKTFRAGRPAMLTFLDVMRQSGLVKDKDFTFNKTDRIVEFPNGTMVEFRSAEHEDDLRGPGLHMLWFDEAAFLPNDAAFLVVYPSLADTQGLLITTTTPNSKNWYYQQWWEGKPDPDVGSVEYWSLDNPHFSPTEWKRYKTYYHPLMFEQEFKASFDAMVGLDLRGDWLQFHTLEEMEADNYYDPKTRRYTNLSLYMGVDPAISLSAKADHFAMALIGVAETGRVYLLETIRTRIDFADQLQLIHQWHMKYRPTLIGIESNTFGKLLNQQAARMSGLPPIVPILNTGKKQDRIMGMSPTFKIGKATILKNHRDFQHEWINFDYQNMHNEDDLLDATDIALQTAGSLHAQGDVTWNAKAKTPDEDVWGVVGSEEHDGFFTSDAAPADSDMGHDW